MENKKYKEYLERKYLPFRSLYLHTFFYPKIFAELYHDETSYIADLGCGTGEFLSFCTKKRARVKGVDNNLFLVQACKNKGFDVVHEDVINFKNDEKFTAAICDNVLEHLSIEEIEKMLLNCKNQLEERGILLIIVPGKSGFKKDYTHKTFIYKELIQTLCAKYELQLEKHYYHPFIFSIIADVFYLNMQVYKIRFPDGNETT